MASVKCWLLHQWKTDSNMIKTLFTLAALGLGLVIAPVHADQSATDQLSGQLQTLQQLQGRFSQTQYAEQSEQAVSTSTGRFRLLKPSYFAWEIETPDSQLIIADGEYLWHHDRDLETVTRRPVAGTDDMSPLQVLAGDSSLLGEKFEVSVTGKGRFRLEPTAGNPGFKELTLIFAADQIGGMEILDNLNQRLFIEFSEVDDQSSQAPADFRFVPPEDADLFYHEQ
ncbi:outer membrane lipoprotein carrier protein LolA [Pseudohalioglobus lutimaris]|uniref:Outer-membrane lipoprotein carrier protein n=2 Tax=Pseudohalioglobus lutimaris TaxID=1737061 RepID=A0A2N5WY94_9GAMM|nr:outer membrane lipoprotein carrier protein LolA [Pseudohalioglobus lutimaris]